MGKGRPASDFPGCHMRFENIDPMHTIYYHLPLRPSHHSNHPLDNTSTPSFPCLTILRRHIYTHIYILQTACVCEREEKKLKFWFWFPRPVILLGLFDFFCFPGREGPAKFTPLWTLLTPLSNCCHHTYRLLPPPPSLLLLHPHFCCSLIKSWVSACSRKTTR